MNRSLRVLVVAGIVLAMIALPAIAVAAITTYRVSVANNSAQAGNASSACGVSADGRFVAFASLASTLVAGDTNDAWDVFVRDRVLGTTERVSVTTGGGQTHDADSLWPSISADGRYVAFMSMAATLVAGDDNHNWDVFVHDRTAHTTVRASVSTTGTEGNFESRNPVISADGHHVVFQSNSTTLVENDTNAAWDVFVRDLLDGTTERVSVADDEAQAGNWSMYPAISADGGVVAFVSRASNLVVGDESSSEDVFVRDRVAGTTELINRDSGGEQADGWSGYPSISGDGRYVAFESQAANLVAGNTNGTNNIYLRDRTAGTTVLVSVAQGGVQNGGSSYSPSCSADGRYIAFGSEATTLVAGDTNGTGDVFVRDMLAGVTERVSVATGGGEGNDYSTYDAFPVISSNGRFVVYDSIATNLVHDDTNLVGDTFLSDRGLLGISISRSPSKSSVTYRHVRGWARFTLSATVKDSRGVPVAGTRVYLEHSNNGRTKWHTHAQLTTNSAGKVSRAFKTARQSSSYFRWHVHASDVRGGKTTSKQKVVVK